MLGMSQISHGERVSAVVAAVQLQRNNMFCDTMQSIYRCMMANGYEKRHRNAIKTSRYRNLRSAPLGYRKPNLPAIEIAIYRHYICTIYIPNAILYCTLYCT